jgi:hypothetical protein
MLKKIAFRFIFFTVSLFAFAQEARPVIRFTPFVFQGVSSEETRFIESLIQSYIADAGELIFNYDNIPPDAYLSGGGLLTGSWNKTPDYILSGSIYLERKTRVFTMEIRNTHTNEIFKTTTEHKTAGDLVLRSRSLVESIIKLPVLTGVESAAVNEAELEIPQIITENSIAGTWRGEPGIEIIRLQPRGRGTAFFSSGAQMNLSYAIEGNVLKIWQNSPNIERFYYPNPSEIAKLLSERAEPMRWEFMLYSGGNRLRGTKTSTGIRILQNGNAELLYETVRDAVLIRSFY